MTFTFWNRQGTPPKPGIYPVLLGSAVIAGMEVPSAMKWSGQEWLDWQCQCDPLPVVAWAHCMRDWPDALAFSHLFDPARLAREEQGARNE